jgi:hypothetical protein
MCWASRISVLMYFAQQNTWQNTWNFLLHTCLVRFFVASQPTSTPQYVSHILYFFVTLQNTNTQLHITLLAFYLHSLLYPLCETGATVHSTAMNCQWLLKFTSSWVTSLSMTAGLPMGWRKWGKLPALSIKFRARASRKFVLFWHHMM